MLIDKIGEITRRLEKEGKLKNLSREKNYNLNKKINDKMIIASREYRLKNFLSEEAAKKIYLNY